MARPARQRPRRLPAPDRGTRLLRRRRAAGHGLLLARDPRHRLAHRRPRPAAPDQVGDGGAAWLFDVLATGTPEAYREFAEDYYETAVGLDAVRHVFALRPLTEAVVTALNPGLSLADLAADLAETGYPTAN
ncbi:hypothetical protein [Kitasatospora sp. NPDC088134]|uniref:hypothetical protein n=1 Tax=Kitasatospora sp. NPDC088134 TaxID=3364071 RepID=UPI0038123E6E